MAFAHLSTTPLGPSTFAPPMPSIGLAPQDSGYRHADKAVSGGRESGVYNARRFNCDPTAYPRILRLKRAFQTACEALKSSLQGQ
jgi:hypothetical protein